MNILAIDTTGLVASVALVSSGIVKGEFTLNHALTHSQTVMPLVEQLTEMLGFDLAEADAIACASGPGSFTGLRIGAATAKGLAYALDKKIIAVPTLDALAYNVFDAGAVIVPIMDAKRNQVYSALYKWEDGKLCRVTEHMAEDIQVVMAEARAHERVVFLGDGTAVHHEAILAEACFSIAPPHLNAQRAAAVGAYAQAMVPGSEWQTADSFMPVYLRPSQAEREAAAKAGGKAV